MIGATELGFLRQAQSELMPSAVTLSSGSSVSDGAGGYTITWPTSGSALGRVGSPRGNLAEVAGRLDESSVVQITLPTSVCVIAGDRVTVEGVTFTVLYVETPKTWETARRVLAKEL